MGQTSAGMSAGELMAVVKVIISGHCGTASHSTSGQTTQQAPLIGEEDDAGFNISGNGHFYEGL